MTMPQNKMAIIPAVEQKRKKKQDYMKVERVKAL